MVCPYVLLTLRGTCCTSKAVIQIHRAIHSLSELVIDGKNGVIFQNAAGLVDQLEVIYVALCCVGLDN